MTHDQRGRALTRANEAREVGAQLRAAIRAAGPREGATRAARVVMDGTSSMRFMTLLRAIPRIGDSQTRQILGRSEISPMARVNDQFVSGRRRQLLVHELLHLANRTKGER